MSQALTDDSDSGFTPPQPGPSKDRAEDGLKEKPQETDQTSEPPQANYQLKVEEIDRAISRRQAIDSAQEGVVVSEEFTPTKEEVEYIKKKYEEERAPNPHLPCVLEFDTKTVTLEPILWSVNTIKTLLVGEAKSPTTLKQVAMDILHILGRATLSIIVKLMQALTLYRKKGKDGIEKESSTERIITNALSNSKFNDISYHFEGANPTIGRWVWGPRVENRDIPKMNEEEVKSLVLQGVQLAKTPAEKFVFEECKDQGRQVVVSSLQQINQRLKKKGHPMTKYLREDTPTDVTIFSLLLDNLACLPQSQGTAFQIAWLASRSSFMRPNVVVDDEEFLVEVHRTLVVLTQYNLAKCIGDTFFFMDFQEDYVGTKFCTRTNCQCCLCINPFGNSTVTLPDGTTLYLDVQADCESTCLSYLITCERCKTIYVGKTDKELWKRFAAHLCQSRGPCGLHPGHCKDQSFRIQVLQCGQDALELPVVELKWQMTLGSFWPIGLCHDSGYMWFDLRCRNPHPNKGKIFTPGTITKLSKAESLVEFVGSLPATVIGRPIDGANFTSFKAANVQDLEYCIQKAIRNEKKTIIFNNLQEIIHLDVKENPPVKFHYKNKNKRTGAVTTLDTYKVVDVQDRWMKVRVKTLS